MDMRETWPTAAMPTHHTPSSSPFMSLLNQPDPDRQSLYSRPNDPLELELELELDECDVVWSSSNNSDSPSASPPPQSSFSTTIISSSPPPHPHSNHLLVHQQSSRFSPSKHGLSAALSDDSHPLVRHKPTLNPSFSATSAARSIPPINSSSSPSNGRFKYHLSAPVNVPAWPKRFAGAESFRDRNGGGGNLEEVDDDELEDEGEEVVPPHLIVAKSHVTFSVFEGVGRTLKGRDLRRLRNTIFQKTGFLE